MDVKEVEDGEGHRSKLQGDEIVKYQWSFVPEHKADRRV